MKTKEIGLLNIVSSVNVRIVWFFFLIVFRILCVVYEIVLVLVPRLVSLNVTSGIAIPSADGDTR